MSRYTPTCRYRPRLNISGTFLCHSIRPRTIPARSTSPAKARTSYTSYTCGIQYVEQTKNHIIDRFQGHFNDISSGRDTTVASHFNTCTPSDSDKLSNIETTVLDFIKANPHSLTAGKQSDSKEKHWIHQLHTVVPRGLNSGHNLPDKSCVADTAMQIELA